MTEDTKKVLVTSAVDFDSHLVDALPTNGINVSVLDNPSSGNLPNIRQSAEKPLSWRKTCSIILEVSLVLPLDLGQFFEFVLSPPDPYQTSPS